MTTRLSRPWIALLLLAAVAVGGAGCRKKQEPVSTTVPALRFAGVDLEYALERLVTEAGWILCVDEISPKDQSPDLGLVRVDLDLPAGSLEAALRMLRDKVGGFDYELNDGVVYVRSNMVLDAKTPLDMPLLSGTKFHGELGELTKYIMLKHPSSFIITNYSQGGFAGPPVTIDIPDKSSVKDALINYARTAKAGWKIRRGGQMTRDVSGAPAIIGTTVSPIGPRKGISRLPQGYNKLSGTSALADMTARLQTPILVYDRTILQDVRGILNLVLKTDPKQPLHEGLDTLGASGFGPGNWHYHWREEDGLPVVRTNHFLFFLRGRDILSAPLLAGEFEGSLPELARWINAHQKSPNGEVLMGGEIADGLPRAKLKIESGETVHEVLVQFAKASGVSPYVLVLDMANPISHELINNPRAWSGVYLQDLAEWRTKPGDEHVPGVIKNSDAK